MQALIFKSIYIIGLVAGGAIRTHYGRQYRQATGSDARQQISGIEALLLSLWGIAQLLGLVYVFTGWLNFANCRVWGWLKWLSGAVGAPVYAAGVWLLWRSHTDLGRSWSPALEIQPEQVMITGGVYRRIRHPMYAAHWLWAVGQALLLHNWIAGLAGLVAIAPLTWYRVPREEQMMLNQFGDDYRIYRAHTGAILPRI
jgi:protein-S-isoprenylcysteine O-methyltransferase Ste14